MRTYKDLLASARLHAGFHDAANVSLPAIIRTLPHYSTNACRQLAEHMADHIQALEDKRVADEALVKEIALKEQRERGAEVFGRIKELKAILLRYIGDDLYAQVALKVSKQERKDLFAYLASPTYVIAPFHDPLGVLTVLGIEVIER